MILVLAGTGGLTVAEANTAMDDWVSNNTEWVEDPGEHKIALADSGTDVMWLHGSYRFELTDAKDNLLQKAGDKLENKVPWYRLVYHQCDHDEDDRPGCPWDEKQEWTDKDVTIPPEPPDPEVS